MHDNDDENIKDKTSPVSGNGLECFSLSIQLNLADKENTSTEDIAVEDLSLSAYWLENLNTPIKERIKSRFTPGATFFDLQQQVDEVERASLDERVNVTLGKSNG